MATLPSLLITWTPLGVYFHSCLIIARSGGDAITLRQAEDTGTGGKGTCPSASKCRTVGAQAQRNQSPGSSPLGHAGKGLEKWSLNSLLRTLLERWNSDARWLGLVELQGSHVELCIWTKEIYPTVPALLTPASPSLMAISAWAVGRPAGHMVGSSELSGYLLHFVEGLARGTKLGGHLSCYCSCLPRKKVIKRI